MTIQIRKAERSKAKLRLGMAGPSGSGKTYSSLLLAMGLGAKVGLIDTEHGSGDLYADLGDYDVISIEAPYTVQKYLEAMAAFESAGYDVIIIDSLTHAWAGDGGLLDKQGKIADRSGNSYTAWRTVTPEHNQLVEAMLATRCHLIATVRAKQEYSQEKDDKGKSVVKKLGMAPVQREGMEYEFTVFLDLDMDHIAKASKDRTSLFDGQYFKVDKKVAKRLLDWLNTGKEPEARPAKSVEDGEVVGMDKVKLTNQLDDNVSEYELGFIDCLTLPDLAAHFDKAQKEVRGYVPKLGAEVVKPFLDRLIAAKDTRKVAMAKQQQAPQTPAADLLGDGKMTPEDVKSLEKLGAEQGLTVSEILDAAGVREISNLLRADFAGVADRIKKAAAARREGQDAVKTDMPGKRGRAQAARAAAGG
jgi:hypothetical protein